MWLSQGMSYKRKKSQLATLLLAMQQKFTDFASQRRKVQFSPATARIFVWVTLFLVAFFKYNLVMAGMLEGFVDQMISVITNDGRNIVGTLRGFDQLVNVILDECHERVYSPNGVEQVALGLYIVRGDNVAAIGEIDEARDKKIDFSTLRAQPLKPVVH